MKDRPMSPELLSPGLESVRSDEGEKEVYSQPQPPDDGQTHQDDAASGRICGMGRKWFWAIFALAFVVVVGLSTGLGAGLGIKHKT